MGVTCPLRLTSSGRERQRASGTVGGRRTFRRSGITIFIALCSCDGQASSTGTADGMALKGVIRHPCSGYGGRRLGVFPSPTQQALPRYRTATVEATSQHVTKGGRLPHRFLSSPTRPAAGRTAYMPTTTAKLPVSDRRAAFLASTIRCRRFLNSVRNESTT